MAKEWLVELTGLVVPIIELMALIIIVAGTMEAFFRGLYVMVRHPSGHVAVRSVWMQYSRWLVAGLTFQLAADIIETSVTPGWEDIGRIGAIALIRTFLNFFLERDQHEVRELQQRAKEPRPE
ncbi:DUF1622 domain-containing protein [Mesorhizobium sp. ANAO-SY3R2]|uniref:DUF1622 domain-containing protein n=1 Tax=Mesorhizobium sp. ANAO-SY3R2 TaxID=3166644 RepID=UPI00366B7BFE